VPALAKMGGEGNERTSEENGEEKRRGDSGK
jgi:hypothetical protein